MTYCIKYQVTISSYFRICEIPGKIIRANGTIYTCDKFIRANGTIYTCDNSEKIIRANGTTFTCDNNYSEKIICANEIELSLYVQNVPLASHTCKMYHLQVIRATCTFCTCK